MENTENRLFESFAPISKQAWQEKIKVDLKGADYEKKMLWMTDNGFSVQPFYMSEDLQGKVEALPGVFPYTRSLRSIGNHWKICQEIAGSNIRSLMEEAIANGVNSITLHLQSPSELEELCKGLDFANIELHISTAAANVEAKYLQVLQDKQGSYHFDPLGVALQSGKFPSKLDDLPKLLSSHFSMFQSINPNFRGLLVDGVNFHNAGANLTNELAFTLALGSEYLAILTEKGIDANQIAKFFKIRIPVGSNYFLEIAKIRSLRTLWSRILHAYQIPKDSIDFHIHAITSSWNKTIYDSHVNLLRTTTEAMSAAIGGCDTISILPFDSPYSHGDSFSQRIARNIQHLLKNESYLHQVLDPSAGSYYLENLTELISQRAWSVFQDIEAKGGFLQAICAGELQKRIAENRKEKDKQYAIRKETILGVNQFPPREEEALVKQENLPPAAGQFDSFTGESVEALPKYRAAAVYEGLRLQTESYQKKTGKTPTVYLLPIGNLAMRIARSTFAANFFSCAGYKIIDSNGFSAPEDGVADFFAKQADILVICSSDEEYPEVVPPICQLVRQKKPDQYIVLAGYPKDTLQTLLDAGVNDCIHVRTNTLEFLQQCQVKLGIGEAL
ncbi:MAG: methylmalonyl-CoA mutase family protein [Spirochaetota bacterium]